MILRAEVLEYIYSKNDLKQFIREQPAWYRRLSRHPEELNQFEIASLNYYKRTIPHRVDKFNNGLQMASMMMGMLQNMNF
jgi:hypothetical protein